MQKIGSITLHVGHVVSVEVTPLIDKVIQIAKKARQAGMTKVDAVRQIYPAVAKFPRESIWYAIIHGVDRLAQRSFRGRLEKDKDQLKSF